MVLTRSAAAKRQRSPAPNSRASVSKRLRSNNANKPAFNFTRLPPNSLLNIMRRLAPQNAVSAKIAIPKSNVTKHALTGMKLKNLLNMGKHNHARYFSPTYANIVRGIRESNNAPMRNGYTVGYHRRRVANSQAMLNALRLANNGFYKNTRPGRGNTKYRYNKKYGGTLSSTRGGTTRVVMKGIKRTPNGTGLMLRH